MKESKQAIGDLFSRSGIELSDFQLDRFRILYRKLVEKNPEADLTRLVTFEDIVVKHFIDSVMPGRLVDLPSPLLDIGTGAGFPALPLAIMNPGLSMVLAEPRKKRVAFILEMIDLLSLTGAEVYPHKVMPDFPISVSGVITRALESAEETLARCAPFLAAGARVILMKGPAAGRELDPAAERAGGFFRLDRDIPYGIPHTPYERRLLVFERTDREWTSERSGTAEPRGGAGVVDIVSAANVRFREFRGLLSGRGLKKEGTAVVSGAKVIDEIVRERPADIVGWIGTHKTGGPPDTLAGVPWYRLSGELFSELDVHGTGGALILLAVPELPAWEDSEKNEGLTLFIPFQDPANVGAVIRSAAALGARRVVLLSGAANPYHHKAVRAAGAGLFRVPLMRGPSIEALAVKAIPLFTLSADGESIAKAVLPRTMGLLAGVEGPGVPERFKQKRLIGIPMEKGSESLNAAVSAAVAMYEWYRRHHTK
ncbi:MAG: class I SAM-dependent methyltransferase [Deltaproteobacteria bacterium]|nr:class I SAM-dependent methyltransferase [Candidatus Zymogenaceae bacterium]